MRILLDTNVVLDFLLKREPWFSQAANFWQAIERELVRGYVSATTVTDIFYIARRSGGLAVAHAAVRECLAAFDICPVDRHALEQAAALPEIRD